MGFKQDALSLLHSGSTQETSWNDWKTVGYDIKNISLNSTEALLRFWIVYYSSVDLYNQCVIQGKPLIHQHCIC